MEISVGRPYHEGGKLSAAFAWAERWPRVHILLADTSQRFNLIHQGATPADAEALSLAAGDEWLQRNAGHLNNHPRFELSRWNDWKNDSRFGSAKTQIEELYKTLPAFRASIDKTVRDFYQRNNYTDWHRFEPISRAYLIEESAVFSIAYADLKGFSAYPGSFLKTWDLFVGGPVPGSPAGFQHCHHAVLNFTRAA